MSTPALAVRARQGRCRLRGQIHASRRAGCRRTRCGASAQVRAHEARGGLGGSRFLQTDPVPAGSSNAYDYAGQDPINTFDLDGRCWTCASEWAAGFGDTVTFGGTKQIRRLINHGLNGDDGDMVNHHSDFYRWGGRGGLAASLLPTGSQLGASSRLFGNFSHTSIFGRGRMGWLNRKGLPGGLRIGWSNRPIGGRYARSFRIYHPRIPWNNGHLHFPIRGRML